MSSNHVTSPSASQTGTGSGENHLGLIRGAIIRSGVKVRKSTSNLGLVSSEEGLTRQEHLDITRVGMTGLEPGTSTVSWWRSNQLSYTPYRPTTLP